MKTLQEVFDIAAGGMLKQGKKSVSSPTSSGCNYRGYDGGKCAVGFLITDENYSESLEAWEVTEVVVRDALAKSGIDMENEQMLPLLKRLQELHDYRDAYSWASGLQEIAHDFDLSPNF